jgi:type I restriction enzyme, S subunit
MEEATKHNRIPEYTIDDRIDAEYYAKAFINNESKLSFFNNQLLAHLLDKRRKNQIADLTTNGSFAFLRTIEFNKNNGVPFLRTKNLKECHIDDGEIIFVNQSCNTKVEKCRCEIGDLVICRKGKLGCASSIPPRLEGAVVSENITRFAIDCKSIDSDFVAAFLNSNPGKLRFIRESTGIIQQWLNIERLRKIQVIVPFGNAQTYIGDKVRQAERLRTRARELEREVSSFHQSLIPNQSALDYGRRSRKTPFERLTDRLDAHSYPAVVEDYMRSVRLDIQSLNDLSELITNGKTMAPVEDGHNSIRQITVTNLSPIFLKGEPRVVSIPLKKEKITKTHDLLICNAAHNKDYIGREITYCRSEDDYLPSTEVMLVRLDRDKVPASYIRCYLLTKIGFIQIQSTVRGITAHSYPQDVRSLRIPIPMLTGDDKTEWFNQDDKMDFAGKCVAESVRLTNAAKLFVEALIEGHISEADLVSAQKALEAGDRTADREILSRLTPKGMDVAGEPPLFPDLAGLYSMLDALNTPEDAS